MEGSKPFEFEDGMYPVSLSGEWTEEMLDLLCNDIPVIPMPGEKFKDWDRRARIITGFEKWPKPRPNAPKPTAEDDKVLASLSEATNRAGRFLAHETNQKIWNAQYARFLQLGFIKNEMQDETPDNVNQEYDILNENLGDVKYLSKVCEYVHNLQPSFSREMVQHCKETTAILNDTINRIAADKKLPEEVRRQNNEIIATYTIRERIKELLFQPERKAHEKLVLEMFENNLAEILRVKPNIDISGQIDACNSWIAKFNLSVAKEKFAIAVFVEKVVLGGLGQIVPLEGQQPFEIKGPDGKPYVLKAQVETVRKAARERWKNNRGGGSGQIM